jgi:galactokinase/mevalonate kinase-like predicted kinase
VLFDRHWNVKRRPRRMTTPRFDEIYERARAAAPWAGRIRRRRRGFFAFYVEEHHGRFTEEMEKLGCARCDTASITRAPRSRSTCETR